MDINNDVLPFSKAFPLFYYFELSNLGYGALLNPSNSKLLYFISSFLILLSFISNSLKSF
jgi:hypothetical protein